MWQLENLKLHNFCITDLLGSADLENPELRIYKRIT